ncbi:MAG: hypothetical protein B7Z40_22490 [Bosea sp. 12-68-7]|nr:MAG: hypothetical protein B7Z40_22490 [Bosea sp. 12-68-7]
MTLILWRGGDPFADELTLEAGASVRCSRRNRAGDTLRQTAALGGLDREPGGRPVECPAHPILTRDVSP